jgi:hypothetical protein
MQLPDDLNIFRRYFSAKEANRQGNYQESQDLLGEALSDVSALHSDTTVEANLQLAFSLFKLNTSSGRVQAVAIYKAIVADTRIQPFLRALALNDMAFLFDLSGEDVRFMKEVVFCDEPYRSLWLGVAGNINKAIFKLYEQSDILYPTTFAKFQMAARLGGQILNQQLPDPVSAALMMQRLLGEGEALMDAIHYPPSKKAYLLLRKAMIVSNSEKVLGNIPLSTVEAAFEKVISFSESSDVADVQCQTIGMLGRIYYAMALSSRFGEKRPKTIRNLLAPFSDAAKADPTLNSIKTAMHNLDNHFFAAQLSSLAQCSPEFGAFLSRSRTEERS